MSGWIKSFVSRKDKSNPGANNNNNVNSPGNNNQSGSGKSVADNEKRKSQTRPSNVSKENVDKLKSLWTLYVNMHSEHDKYVQLTKILPLFLNTYDKSDIKDISQTFGDLKKFMFIISRKFVRDIRTSWKSNLPAEENARIVLNILSTQGGDQAGYETLRVLEQITQTSYNVEVAVDAAVPSTIVTIFQLLFTLPAGVADSYPPETRCEDSLIRLLNYMCNFRIAITELTKTDTLPILFNIMTAFCLPHTQIHQHSILGVVRSVLKFHMDREIIDYFHSKNLVQIVIANIKKYLEKFPQEYLILVWSNIVEWMKSSATISVVLVNDFANASGYEVLLDTLMFFEKEENRSTTLPKLLDVICGLVYVGKSELTIPASISPYNNPVLSVTENNQNCVRNIKAFQIFQSFFLSSKYDEIKLKILDNILSIYASNYLNFLLLQQLHTLAHFIEDFENQTNEVKEGIIKVLIFVVTVVNYVPFQELSSLSCLLQPNPSFDTISVIYSVCSKLINFSATYRKIFQEAGLLHMLITLIKQYSASMKQLQSPEKENDQQIPKNNIVFSVECFQMTLKCTTIILHKNPDSVRIFRESGCPALLHNFIINNDTRIQTLQLLMELIDTEAQDNSDISHFLQLLSHPIVEEKPNVNNVDLQTNEQQQEERDNDGGAERLKNFDYLLKFDILNAIMKCFNANERIKDSFRECGGFYSLLNLLKVIGEKDLEISEENRCSIITNLFQTLTIAIFSHTKNRTYFRKKVIPSLQEALYNIDLWDSPIVGFEILCSLLSLATEDINPIWDPERLLVFNPEILLIVFDLFSFTTIIETKVAVLQRILQIISLGKRNQEPLCAIGLLGFILCHFRNDLLEATPLQPLLLSFIEQLGMHRITPEELKQYIRFIEKKNFPPQLLTSLSRMATNSSVVPYIEFDLQRSGFACLHLPSFGDRSWPPANGYTILFWIYIDTFDGQLDLFQFISDDKRSSTLIYIQDDKLILQTTSKNIVEFPFQFRRHQWYHIALVHSRSRFQTSEAKLYVDGDLACTVKSPYISTAIGGVGAFIGTPPDRIQMSDSIWRIGPCYLVEEVFSWEMVLTCFCLGPRYIANFQGSFSPYASFTYTTARTLSILATNECQTLLTELNSSFSLSEERIIFALNANNIKQLTKTDSFSNLLFQGSSVGLTIYNSSDLSGTLRGLLTGGCMAVSPSGISNGICKIGGILVVFLLIEKADTPELLLDSINLLVVLIKDNPRISREMDRIKGYPLLSDFLYKKRSLINAQILEKLLELSGIIPVRRNEDPVISNVYALRYVILNFQLWKWTPIDVQVTYFRRLNNLLVNNTHAKFNIARMRKLHFLQKLLFILKEEVLDPKILDWVSIVITNFVSSELLEDDLHLMTSFLISTVDQSVQKSSEKSSANVAAASQANLRKRRRAVSLKASNNNNNNNASNQVALPLDVKIRNIILEIIINQLMQHAENLAIFHKVITVHWIFLFLEKTLHSSTIILSLKILVMMLQSKGNFKAKFESAEGFGFLSNILPYYYDKPAIYYILFCLLLGKQIESLPVDTSSLRCTLPDLIQTFSAISDKYYHIACIEVILVITSILKRLCMGSDPSPPYRYINTIIPGCDSAPHAIPSSVSTPVVSSPNPVFNEGGAVVRAGLQPSHSSNLNDHNIIQSSGKGNIREDGVPLLKWKILETEFELQKELFGFLSHILENSPEFLDVFVNDRVGDKFYAILLPLFPYNQLNFPTITPSHHIMMDEENRCHFSAKYIFEFLQTILVNVAVCVNGKIPQLFDSIFDSIPVAVNEIQHILFQSKVLWDFVGYVKSIPKDTIIVQKTLATNIAKFCGYLVDKVGSGIFAHGGKFTFVFLVELLEKLEEVDHSFVEMRVAPSHSNKGAAAKSKIKNEVQMIYKALNRTTIQTLGVPHGKTREDFMYVIQTAIFHQEIVLNLWNNDNEFIFVICHLLYKFLLDDNKKLREGAMNVWKLLLLTKIDTIRDILVYKPPKGEVIDLTDGFNLLLNKDFNQFYFWMGDAVQTEAIHTVLEEQLSSVWLSFQDTESKIRNEHLKSSKSRRLLFSQKIDEKRKRIESNFRKMESWRNTTIVSTKDRIFVKYKKQRQEDLDLHKYLQTRWGKIKSTFYQERSVWGSDDPCPLDKWKLDLTEGPFRMRKKFKKYPKFYELFPYVEGLKPGQHSAKIPTSLDSKAHYLQYGGKVVEYSGSSVRKMSVCETSDLYASSDQLPSIEVTFSEPSSPQDENKLNQSPTKSPPHSHPNITFHKDDKVWSYSTPVMSLQHCHSIISDSSPPRSNHSLPSGLDIPNTDNNNNNNNNNSNVLSPSPVPSPLPSPTPSPMHSPAPSPSPSPSTSPSLLPLSFAPEGLPEDGLDPLYSSFGEDNEKLLEMMRSAANNNNNDNELETLNDNDDISNFDSTSDDFDFEEEDDDDEDKIKRLLESGDTIEFSYNCGRIDGMINNPAILFICSNNLYLIDNYTITDEGEIIETEDLQSNFNNNNGNNGGMAESNFSKATKTRSEPSYPSLSKIDEQLNISHQIRKWGYEDIKDIFRRRYLLRPVAIEIFSNDGRNFLIALSDPINCEKVFKNLEFKLCKSSNLSIEERISGSQNESLGLSLNNRKFFKKDMTQKWVQGEISNFQYLMHLNTVAGRSYNDLTQYPVFPWVLSDYESAELDFSDLNIYRDLSKPMGALSRERAQEFISRYENWDPIENLGVPKWHYGSHYSSAGIVLYYLIRLEPFVNQFLKFLQSGRFDVADRLFHSIHECWLSASGFTNNMSDVKELIPEFYYLPELFENRNRFDFGVRQTTEVVDDVVLPPWAKGSAYEFVRLHRKALESPYVSANLHEWIDLIFGYKQKGKAAEENLNVFYYLTYEGSVNIDAIADPIEKDSVIAQINNFGQTPKQLFTKPHPKRQNLSFFDNLQIINALVSPKREYSIFREINKPVGYIKVVINEKVNKIVILGQNKISLPTRSYNKYFAWGYLDLSVRIYSLENDKLLTVLENFHDSQITCVATTEDGKYLITGSLDTVITVHKIHKIKGGRQFELQGSLAGHNRGITCIAVSRSYSAILSASEDGTCILWDLNRLEYVRQIIPPLDEAYSISCISINNISGEIVIIAHDTLCLYTINGDLLLTHRTNLPISSFFSTEVCEWLGFSYFTGHPDGTIKVWHMGWEGKQRTLTLKTTLKAHNAPVTYLHAFEKRLFSGDANGRVMLIEERLQD